MALQFSNTKFLQVLLKQPNPDAGWYVEAFDKENATRKVISFTVIDAFFKPIMGGIGVGYIDLPVDDPAIPLLIDTNTKVTSLLHVYLDGVFRYAFYADNEATQYNEKGNAVAARIRGLGMEAATDRSVVGNQDHPASPSLNPTWVYGSSENFIQNPGFDDGGIIVRNPGGEDGNDDDGLVEGWSSFGDIVLIRAFQDSLKARTGDWYISVEGTTTHTGIKQSIACTPNRTYHVRAYVKDETAAGMRVTMSLGGATDITAVGVTYPENYEYDDSIYAELDNVARNPAKDGTPGGSTDGTWQVLDVEVRTGAEQTSLDLAIQDDHHGGGGVHVEFWIDDVTLEGWGLGLDPWVAFAPSDHATNSFRLYTGVSYDGSAFSCKINPISLWAGIQQVVQLNPNTRYTLSCWGYVTTVAAGDSWKLEVRLNDGDETPLGDTGDIVPVAESWVNFQFVMTTPSTTEVEVIIRFVYTGSNNPVPLYADSFSCVPGEPPSTAGKIALDLLAAIQAQGELLYLTTTFTATLDSKGYPWPLSLSLDVDPSETLFSVLSRFVALGHEFNVVPQNFDEGGNSGFALNLYTARAFNPDSGLGLNFEGMDDAPVIMPSDATIGGRIARSVNFPNRVVVGGPDGLWTQAFQDDIATYEAGYGKLSEYISAPSGVNQDTLAQYAQARLAELRDRELGIQLNMQRSATLRPFLHFGLGTSIPVDIPPHFLGTVTQRIRAIATLLSGEGSDITFVVDVSRVLYEDEAALFAKIAQLAERAPNDTSSQGAGRISSTGSVSGGGRGGSYASVVHDHSLGSSQITDKTLSGDMSGTLPGPVTVHSVKGMPISSTIPADASPKKTLLVYDYVKKIWGPSTETLGGGGGGGGAVPAWIQHLVDRTVGGESVHADDDEFDDETLAGTALTVSGSATWIERLDVLSVAYEDQSAADIAARLYALTPGSAPVTIETALRVLATNDNYYTVGLLFSDGVVAASNSVFNYWDSSEPVFSLRSGTLGALSSGTQTWDAPADNASLTALLYMRLIWTAANTFAAAYSNDGVSWTRFALAATLTKTLTPTHFGVGVSSWGGSVKQVCTFEYLRVTEADLSL